jgi:hypothetical protein
MVSSPRPHEKPLRRSDSGTGTWRLRRQRGAVTLGTQPAKRLIALWIVLVVVLGLPTFTSPALAADKIEVLHRFSGTDGQFPYYGNLIFDSAGNLYGTTYYGGTGSSCGYGYGCGTVFKLAPEDNGQWRETVLHSFQNDGSDGYYPAAGLNLDTSGNLYGTTSEGGANRVGTVFELTRKADGSYRETVLYSFCSVDQCADGMWPYAGLIFDAKGNLYGTTYQGGATTVGGTVFQLSRDKAGTWSETTLASFNGAGGPLGGVIFDKAGNLYGTVSSWYGGCSFSGSVFELKAVAKHRWKQIGLHNFFNNGKDGVCPIAGVILDPQGNLYGTTTLGGRYDAGITFKLVPGVHGSWKETIVHSFNINEGAEPYGGLVRDTAGHLFGTLAGGGSYGLGNVFELTPSKQTASSNGFTEKILLNFDGSDGIYPFAGLILDSAGNLYGATYYGGNLSDCSYQGCGVVFELTP